MLKANLSGLHMHILAGVYLHRQTYVHMHTHELHTHAHTHTQGKGEISGVIGKKNVDMMADLTHKHYLKLLYVV